MDIVEALISFLVIVLAVVVGMWVYNFAQGKA